MQLSLLGGFEIAVDARCVHIGQAGQRVLAFLALRRNHFSSREWIASELWPDRPHTRSLANLRSVLWRFPPEVRRCIVETPNGLALAPDVAVDIDLLDPSSEQLPSPDTISAPLLPGWYEDWVITERERIELRRIAALEEIAHAHLTRGEFSEAIDLALAAIASEPFRESLHRIVMRSHIAEGNFSEAKSHFDRLRSLLEIELEVAPSMETTALIEESAMTGARRRSIMM